MHKRGRLCYAATAIAMCLLLKAGAAAELPPAASALPDETALVVRIPGAAAFVDALRQQTKLGAVLLGPDRLDRIAQAIISTSTKDWDELRESLGRYDLKPDDWRELVRGEMGFAVALEPRADREPLVIGLGWLDASEDLAPRLLAAVQTIVAEETEGPHAPVRDDLQLAGIEVTHLSQRIFTTDLPKIDFTPGPSGELTEEDIQARIAEHAKQLEEAKEEETDRVHLFFARMGGRLLLGTTFPQSTGKVRATRKAGSDSIDWDAVTGLEAATATFGRFLSAHGGGDTGRVAGLLATPGVGERLPAGAPLVEIVGDPRPLVKLADLDGTGRARQAIEAMGLASLGPLALRVSLDGSVLRSALALSAPAPRSGLIELLDQAPLEPDPPAWVPASADEYQAISFDLSKAYASIKQLARRQGGQKGDQAISQVETFARLLAGAEVSALLASVDNQFSILSFPAKAGQAAEGDEPNKGAAAVRLGIVVRVSDEQVWKRLLDQFANSQTGGLKAVEEQGFGGYRLPAGGQDLGIFLANGHLAVGFGPTVSESLLSVLRTPPEGAAALRTSGLVERARSLLPLEKCLSYSLAGASSGAELRQELLSLIGQLTSSTLFATSAAPAGVYDTAPADAVAGSSIASAPEQAAWAGKLKELVPGVDELEGAVGVSVDQMVVDDQGLVVQSALELPAP